MLGLVFKFGGWKKTWDQIKSIPQIAKAVLNPIKI